MGKMRLEHRYMRPYALNHTDSARKIGFELEFSGFEIEQTAAIVASVFEGSPKKIFPLPRLFRRQVEQGKSR